MSKWILIFAVLIPFINACGGTPSVQPVAPRPRVHYVKGISIESPVAVAVDEKGRIYVAGEDGSIEIMTEEGLHIGTLEGGSPDGERILKEPAGLSVYDEKIYVIDRALCRVLVYSCSGKYLDSFGSKGSAIKEFNRPSGIDVSGGIIYVADSGGDRIQVFSTDGIFLQSITGSSAGGDTREAIRDPIGVAVDYRGFVSVTCAGKAGTKIFMPNGIF